MTALRAASLVLLLVVVFGNWRAYAENDVPSEVESQQSAITRTNNERVVASSSDASKYFVVESDGAVRHPLSGIGCLRGSEKFRLTSVTVEKPLPLGSNVSCIYTFEGGVAKVFILHSPQKELAAFEAAEFSEVEQDNPNAKRTDGPMVLVEKEDALPHQDARSYLLNPSTIFSVWIAAKGDWTVMVEATYPAEPRHDPEFTSALAEYWALEGAIPPLAPGSAAR